MRGQPRAMMLGAAALAMMLAGCVQATRHSNAMVFGTNTSLGVNIGPNATSIPAINIGYNRQEAVFLPLVANVRDGPRRYGALQPLLTPCDVGSSVRINPGAMQPSTPSFAVHPCLLVANRGGATDSYSVLASFGGRAGGGATPSVDGQSLTAGNGHVAVAQYFATGIAAQLLAVVGGSALVNTGGDKPSEQEATAATNNLGAAAIADRSAALVDSYSTFRSSLAEHIANEPSDENLVQRLGWFETRIGARAKLSDNCNTRVACLRILLNPSELPYSNLFRERGDDMTAALQQWAVAPAAGGQ